MNKDSYPVKVKDCESGKYVKAMLYSPITDKNIEDYNSLWIPYFDKEKEKLYKEEIRIEDSHWDWEKKIQYIYGKLAYNSFAIEVENITQGMMIIETVLHPSKIEAYKPLVYIEYLATAPWNRKIIVEKPKYRGVGSILIIQAIGESFKKGFKGRVGLCSLSQAYTFYEGKGFVDFGFDTHNNLEYYELSKEAAAKLMKTLNISEDS